MDQFRTLIVGLPRPQRRGSGPLDD